MGTEVDLKSHFPGSLKMRDLNEDTTSMWDPLNDGEMNGHMFTGLMSRTINGRSEYYKALLKQTMLRHDEIFKGQVVELHRLYRVQRDLMDELKRKEERLFPPQVQSTTLPSLFSTYNLQCDMERSDGKGSHLPSSKPMTKTFKKLIDLQLPADAYLDNDDVECHDDTYINRPHHRIGKCGLESEKDVNLTLGTFLNGVTGNKRADVHKLADLNEPLEEASCDELPDPCNGSGDHNNRSIENFPGFQVFQKDLCPVRYEAEIGKSSGFWVSSLSTPCKKETQQSSESFLLMPHRDYRTISSVISPKPRKIEKFSPGSETSDLSSDTAKASPIVLRSQAGNQNSSFGNGGLTSQNPKAVKSVDLNLAPPNGFHCGFDSPKDSITTQVLSPMVSSFCLSNSEAAPRISHPEDFNGFNGRINLNFAATDVSSNGYIKGTSTRFVSEIDLEAPTASLSEDQIPSAESETEDPRAKAAAETIQMMSLIKPPDSPAAAALFLLADVISSYPDEMNKISEFDVMDCFEYKALELKETKMDDLCCGFKPVVDRDDGCLEEGETGGAAALLLNSPRCGPARRRRQRRDFQKDILPALASLSRHEVTEDLQVIGGLMRTSGQRWQSPRGMSVLGWGRTTRRARRQRSSPGNAVVQRIA